MQYLKKLGLAAVAAAALMAFAGAGSASATVLTCGTWVCPKGTVIGSNSEGFNVLDAPFGNIECGVDLTWETENEGSSTETVHGVVTDFEFTDCGRDKVNTLKNGSLEIHTDPSTGEWKQGPGILTSSGTALEVLHLGVQCIFTTNNTELGTITGSTETGGTATLDIRATIPRTGGSGGAFCGSSLLATGSDKVNSPDTFNVD